MAGPSFCSTIFVPAALPGGTQPQAWPGRAGDTPRAQGPRHLPGAMLILIVMFTARMPYPCVERVGGGEVRVLCGNEMLITHPSVTLASYVLLCDALIMNGRGNRKHFLRLQQAEFYPLVPLNVLQQHARTLFICSTRTLLNSFCLGAVCISFLLALERGHKSCKRSTRRLVSSLV